MSILFTLSLVFLSTAIFIIIRPNFNDIKLLYSNFKKSQTLKSQAKNKKQGKIQKLFTTTNEMMKATDQGGIYRVVFFSLLLMTVGIFIGIFLNNFILAPILAVIGFAIPFFIVRVHYINYNQLILDELEPTLSLITTSYERNNNILQAFEENLPYIQEPIKPVFEEFIYTVKHINPNIETAIDEMKVKINHSVFVQWCDALKSCANDHTLKHTLQPIVAKLTEIKVVNGELKNILFSSLRTYYVMLALTAALSVIALFIFPPILDIQLPQIVKDILLSINIVTMFFTTIKVYIETKTINSDI